MKWNKELFIRTVFKDEFGQYMALVRKVLTRLMQSADSSLAMILENSTDLYLKARSAYLEIDLFRGELRTGLLILVVQINLDIVLLSPSAVGPL